MKTKKQQESKTKKTLKGFSRWTGGILFSLALLMLLINLFASALINNTDLLKQVLSDEITNSDIFVDQLIENSGATKEEIKEFCRQNPQEELCKVMDNPGALIADTLGFDELDKNMEPVKQVLKQSKPFILILLFLGVLLHFLGRISIYDMLYKISRTAFIESALGIVLVILSPKFIPNIINKFIPKNIETPVELVNLALNAVDKWFNLAIAEFKTTMIIIAVVSLALSITAYILNKKNKSP